MFLRINLLAELIDTIENISSIVSSVQYPNETVKIVSKTQEPIQKGLQVLVF